jgi:hypothetical protein
MSNLSFSFTHSALNYFCSWCPLQLRKLRFQLITLIYNFSILRLKCLHLVWQISLGLRLFYNRRKVIAELRLGRRCCVLNNQIVQYFQMLDDFHARSLD